MHLRQYLISDTYNTFDDAHNIVD